ncbi:MAG: YggS family pyridoxal phosphate-dependent enzyme [Candidatus Omnitrophota bacterium]|nr:MAG: YggS family pyridoxal phosphate-dependent enzyme [Candidatus Omnitrophota bacterium]
MVRDNLARVKKRIEQAAERAGRDPHTVRLIVVTKEAGIDQMREVVQLGVTDIGENRVKDALSKRKLFDSHLLSWHMIGHLQSNKAKDAVRLFSIIHSVDSVKLAYILDKEAKKNNKIQDILIEVNTSGEETKFGVKPNRVESFLKEARDLKHINILGLMTMAPLVKDSEMARPYFKKLKQLADAYQLKELSMGMTQDFEVAIEEGATMVRIGSAIFKNM